MEHYGYLVVLLVVGGLAVLGRLAGRYLEKVQRAQEEARRRQAPGQGHGQTLSGRPTFYGRPQAGPTAPHAAQQPHHAAPPGVKPAAHPAMPVYRRPEQPAVMRPSPIQGGARHAAPQHAAQHQAARRPAQPPPAHAPAAQAPRLVAGAETRHLHTLGAHKVSSLVGHTLETHMEGGIAEEAELQVVEEPGMAARGFLGNLFAPRNLGRAFAASQIFGPPKALE